MKKSTGDLIKIRSSMTFMPKIPVISVIGSMMKVMIVSVLTVSFVLVVKSVSFVSLMSPKSSLYQEIVLFTLLYSLIIILILKEKLAPNISVPIGSID